MKNNSNIAETSTFNMTTFHIKNAEISNFNMPTFHIKDDCTVGLSP